MTHSTPKIPNDSNVNKTAGSDNYTTKSDHKLQRRAQKAPKGVNLVDNKNYRVYGWLLQFGSVHLVVIFIFTELLDDAITAVDDPAGFADFVNAKTFRCALGCSFALIDLSTKMSTWEIAPAGFMGLRACLKKHNACCMLIQFTR
jgi:hypothetical protein